MKTPPTTRRNEGIEMYDYTMSVVIYYTIIYKVC